MTKTIHTADALRTQLDFTRPDWREKLRADLDVLQPGWKSFPVSVWNELTDKWQEVVLLANPEKVSLPPRTLRSRFAGWLGLR